MFGLVVIEVMTTSGHLSISMRYYQASEYFFMIQIKIYQIINFTLSNQCKYLVSKFAADISKGRIGKTK